MGTFQHLKMLKASFFFVLCVIMTSESSTKVDDEKSPLSSNVGTFLSSFLKDFNNLKKYIEYIDEIIKRMTKIIKEYEKNKENAEEHRKEEHSKLEVTKKPKIEEHQRTESLSIVEVTNEKSKIHSNQVTTVKVHSTSLKINKNVVTPKSTKAKIKSKFTTEGRVGPKGEVQMFTVPFTGCYIITAKGAQGGNINHQFGSNSGGRGAVVEMKLCSLLMGEQLSIVVGQQGENSDDMFDACGGGGGSFVYNEEKFPPVLYVAAGGGGGANAGGYGNHGQESEGGQDGEGNTNSGGTKGNGGKIGVTGVFRRSASGAGAGWYSSGESGIAGDPGKCRNEGWNGGAKSIAGGFGGGGSSSGKYSGAGGGFGGGGSSYSTGGKFGGGGGGSFCNSSHSVDCKKITGDNEKAEGLVTIFPTE